MHVIFFLWKNVLLKKKMYFKTIKLLKQEIRQGLKTDTRGGSRLVACCVKFFHPPMFFCQVYLDANPFFLPCCSSIVHFKNNRNQTRAKIWTRAELKCVRSSQLDPHCHPNLEHSNQSSYLFRARFFISNRVNTLNSH